MNASLEIQNGVKVLGQTPLDKKYYNNNNTPYTSVEQVMTQLPISLRSRGLTVNIAGVEYWWPTSDITIDPVMKSPTDKSVGVLINTLTAKPIPTSSDLWTLRDEVSGLWRKINTTQLLAFLETNFDLKYEPINSVVVNYYVTDLTELTAAWTDAQTKTIPAKIYANGIMNLTSNLILGGTREIPIEGIPSVRFNLNGFELDVYRPHLTSVVLFSPNTNGYIKARNGYATLNRVFFGQDGHTLNSIVVPNIPHVLIVGAYTNNTGGVNINGITHQTSLSHINENPDAIIQPIWIKDTSGQSGQRLFVDIKGVSAARSFDRFSKVLVTSDNPNLIVAVGGDATWFYDGTQPQPGSGINELSTLKPITSVHELRLNDFDEIAEVSEDDRVLIQRGNKVLLTSKTNVGGSTSTIIESETPPENPTNGMRWLDTTSGVKYEYTIGNWVELGPQSLSVGGGGSVSPQIIDMKPGEYLSDIIQSITDATIDNQYTINFYNHSKTINWDTFTQKIHVPRFIHINFVGNIDWWANVHYPRMAFYAGLTDVNPVDKLFIGFGFDRTNADGVTHISGLPANLWKIFFGGLDSSWNVASKYQDLIDNPDDWGIGTLGLVRVNGSKEDDSRNDALYKKINGVFIDVTPEFMYCDFSGCNLNNAYFYSANCQGANFYSANCQGADFYYTNCQSAFFYAANLEYVNWYDVISIQNANFQNADLTGGINLPERINTKAKWIAECGAGNVNAQTIWIDGTSILS